MDLGAQLHRRALRADEQPREVDALRHAVGRRGQLAAQRLQLGIAGPRRGGRGGDRCGLVIRRVAGRGREAETQRQAQRGRQGGAAAARRQRGRPQAGHHHQRQRQQRQAQQLQQRGGPRWEQPQVQRLLGCHGAAPAQRVRAPGPRGQAGAGLHAGAGVHAGEVDAVGRVDLGRGRRCLDGRCRHHPLRHGRPLPACLGRLLVGGRRHGRLFLLGDAERRVFAFEARVDRLADLRHRERQQHQHQQAGHGQPAAREDELCPPRRHHARQRRQRQQAEPQHRWRAAGRVPGQRQRHADEHARAPAQQPVGRQRGQQHEEEVPQRPHRHPRTVGTAGALRMQQPPAGRQLQRGLDMVHRAAPAAGGQRTVARPAAVGLDDGAAVAHLEARGAVLGELRDGLVVAGQRGAAQLARRGHRQPRAGRQRAIEAVAGREVAAVEVQPQRAVQPQRVGRRPGVAALQLGELQRLARLEAEGRQRAPVGRHLHLARVHAGHALGADQPQRGRGLHGPDFLVGGGLGQGQGLHGRVQPRGQLDAPRTRPRLHDEPAVLGQPRGQRAVQLHRHQPRQQRQRQLHGAGAAGHAQLVGGGDGQRQFVVDEAHGLHADAVGCLGRAGRRAQPQPAVAVGCARLRGAVAGHDDGAQAGRHGQVLRRLRPRDAPFDDMRARRQPHGRVAVAVGDGQRLAAGLHVLRPRTGLAGQRHARRGAEHLHVQPERRLARAGVELQSAGPDAERLLRRRHGVHRAAQRRLALLRPRQPVAQRGRQFGGRQRRGLGGEAGGQQQQQRRRESLHHGSPGAPAIPTQRSKPTTACDASRVCRDRRCDGAHLRF